MDEWTFVNLFWIFLIGSIMGAIIEIIFVRFASGIWMSRSSLVIGQFSIVWGGGAVIITIILKLMNSNDSRKIFMISFFLGGVYEYLCSVLSQVFLKTTYWDYSSMKLNIGGRTNVLFCFYWGILAVLWQRFAYPYLNDRLTKLHTESGKRLTRLLAVFMGINMAVSALAILRYVERVGGVAASNLVETFLDEAFPDRLMKWIYPNMRIKG